ncbi:hypothetical protein AB5J62_05335 [Amycolatopsis sp. cg5]|uniref:hypothetical protein n=1 Tax=Amycolatopsis sp. cg5 TaxID=3238802 RepID=UPI00352431CB
MASGARDNTDRSSLLFRLHRARLAIIGLLLIIAGIGLLYLDAGRIPDALSEALLTTGLVGLGSDFAARVLADNRIIEQVKGVFISVLHGPFRVLLDRMNHAPGKRFDVRIDVTLTEAGEAGRGDMFIALVRNSFRTNAPLGERVFICAPKSFDREAFTHQNVADYWIVNPANGQAADDPNTYSVLKYSLNGQAYELHRTVHDGRQIYTATPGKLDIKRGETYHEEYTYRVMIPRAAQWLRFTVDVPTQGFALDVNHFQTNINRLEVLPFFAAETEPRVNESTAAVPAPASITVDGWIAPGSGTAITWTLNDTLEA